VITVAVLIVAGVVATRTGTAGAADRRYFVCAARACLFVLEQQSDRDGDGVTDVDEKRLGTDPDDPSSTPPTLKLIGALLGRKLPSFERRLTELVVLPTLSPDGQAIETGLGDFDLRDGDGDLLKYIGVVITEVVDRNGFEAAFGLKLSGVKPGVGAETPPKYPFSQPEFIRHVDAAVYSNGTTADLTSAGANAGKEVAGETLGSDGHRYITYGVNTVTKNYEINYTDGSKDKVTHQYVKEDDGTTSFHKSVMSYDSEGNPVSAVSAHGHEWTDPDGTKHTTFEYNKPLLDGEGNLIGDQTVKIHLTENPDGSMTIKTTTTTVENGKTKVEVEETTIEAPKHEATHEEYVDPDYIGFDIVTAEDWARVEFRIKQVSMPAPGEGGGGRPLPEQPPNPDRCTKCGADGTMVLMDPDGVVVIATGGEPNFNNRLQPDYDEWIQIMSGMTGAPVPVTGDPGGGSPTDPGDGP
jgi:hypothetical protein